VHKALTVTARSARITSGHLYVSVRIRAYGFVPSDPALQQPQLVPLGPTALAAQCRLRAWAFSRCAFHHLLGQQLSSASLRHKPLLAQDAPLPTYPISPSSSAAAPQQLSSRSAAPQQLSSRSAASQQPSSRSAAVRSRFTAAQQQLHSSPQPIAVRSPQPSAVRSRSRSRSSARAPRHHPHTFARLGKDRLR